MASSNNDVRFDWYVFEGSSSIIELNQKKVFTNIAMLSTVENDKINTIPMFQFTTYSSENQKVNYSFNQSNAVTLSQIMEELVSNDYIRKFFGKTTATGWYVVDRYRTNGTQEKYCFSKILKDTLRVGFTPYVTDQNVPTYRVTFIKISDKSDEDIKTSIYFTFVELRLLSKMLFNFACSCPIYMNMYRDQMYRQNLERQFEKLSSINSALMVILNGLSSNKTIDIQPKESDTSISIPYQDVELPPEEYAASKVDDPIVTSLEPIVSDTVKEESAMPKSNVISMANKEKSFLDLDFNDMIKSSTGMDVVKSDEHTKTQISESQIFPKEYVDSVKPNEITNLDVVYDLDESYLNKYTKDQNDRVFNNIVRTYTKQGAFIPGITKQILNSRLFDANTVISVMVNRGKVGIPASSSIIDVAAFAAAYQYIEENPECDQINIAVQVVQSLQMAEVTACDMFATNDTLKKYFMRYRKWLIKLVTKSEDSSMLKLFKIDRYVATGNYKFSKLNIAEPLTPIEEKSLTRALTEIYFVLQYTNSKYLINPAFEDNNSVYIYEVVNQSMAQFVRSILLNLIAVTKNNEVKAAYAETMIDFKKLVNFLSWEEGIYIQGVFDLLNYQRVFKLNSANVKEGFPIDVA